MEQLDCKHVDCQLKAKDPLACDLCIFNPLGKGPEYREYCESPEIAEFAFKTADLYDFGILQPADLAPEEIEIIKAVRDIREYSNQIQLVVLISRLFQKPDGK